jgi:hypothetical protein
VLTKRERAVYNKTRAIFGLAVAARHVVKTHPHLRNQCIAAAQSPGNRRTSAKQRNGRIIIKRSQLASTAAYAATLLHERAQAKSGADHCCAHLKRNYPNSLASSQ